MGAGLVTLPLSAQDRDDMAGPRYAGAIASIIPDVKFRGEYWVYGMEFQAATRPPFPWAGQQVGGNR